ncbi:probable galacturonosyltransferase-like 9 [Diospyros lotus]|uniref:probable galacturonosyltransferase-like 9 n=1 Tax=Diospyros lotus TaxID=55363 RepID=UPI002251CC1A|nr:probable galacturonosyltransferase-like 9 [Diospyros lotus]
MARLRSASAVAFLAFLIFRPLMCLGIHSFWVDGGAPMGSDGIESLLQFAEAPQYCNGVECSASYGGDSVVHVAMTLDSEYLRGSMAAVHSVLQHASCPENIFFHFVAEEFDPVSPRVLTRLVQSIFPSLNFKVYIFREDTVINLISSSIRQALENSLNYARNYLGDILDPSVTQVIYSDSDVVLVDDVQKLWNVRVGSRLWGY